MEGNCCFQFLSVLLKEKVFGIYNFFTNKENCLANICDSSQQLLPPARNKQARRVAQPYGQRVQQYTFFDLNKHLL